MLQGNSNKGRILVVDDEPTLLRSVTRVLRAKGYIVECATDGQSAVQHFSTGAFDVVLSDIAMPGMDGLELLRSVRQKDLDIPVVLITGEPAVATAVKALEYGAFHYLTKPVELKELEEVIDKAACLRRMAQMKRQAAELVSGHATPDDILAVEASFNRVLDTLWTAYQPIIHAKDGSIFGYEALLRANEPSLPHPGAILDAAERLGRLDQLGRTIRTRAASFMDMAPESATLFVNLHPSDLLDPELTDPNSALAKIANRVILEITERSSLDRIKDVRSRVADLRAMGFRIAIDDLGAGYAGLTSFALLEPEIVKLDMSLIRDIHLSDTKKKLVRSITSLAQDMGMLVVGEGVECDEERYTLVDQGCNLLQGYRFAKPGKPFPEVEW